MRALGVSRTSLVPGGVLAGPWVRDPLWRNARAVPTLDLRFADNKSLTDAVTGASLVTFTRASSGTFVDSAGVIQTAATDVPRFDHNPTTGESLGLLVEESRTNSIRNNTMVGAVAGTPGTLPTNWAINAGAGLTASVAATGTENGINYVDIRISGTTTGTINTDIVPETYVAALTGQAWTQSVYYKLVSGSLSNVSQFSFRFNEWTSGLVFISGQSSAALQTPTANNLATQRVNSSVTLSGGATTAFLLAFLRITCTTGSVDFTLRIGLPQLEQGASSTSVIPTTTAAVTRSADVASITGSAFSSWYRQDEGTFYADTNLLAGGTSTNRFVFEANDGVATTGDKWDLRRTGGSAYRTQVRDGGVSNSDQTISTSANPLRITVAANSSAVFTSANGTATSSAVKFPTGFPTVDRLFIGGGIDGSTLQTNGTIRRLCFWPQRLANSTLQQITQ